MSPTGRSTTASIMPASSLVRAMMGTAPMSAPRSNASATSSEPSMPGSARSRIFLPSDTAGARLSTNRADTGHVLRRLAASLTLKMIGLIVVFVALPVALYSQFESADIQRRDLVIRGIQQRSWLIAQALAPILDQPAGPPHKSLNRE